MPVTSKEDVNGDGTSAETATITASQRPKKSLDELFEAVEEKLLELKEMRLQQEEIRRQQQEEMRRIWDIQRSCNERIIKWLEEQIKKQQEQERQQKVQEEQARRDEEQARCIERQREEQILLPQDVRSSLGEDITGVKDEKDWNSPRSECLEVLKTVQEETSSQTTETSKLDEQSSCVVKEVVAERFIKSDQSDEWEKTLKSAQEKDSDIKPILDWMKDGASKPDWSDVTGKSTTTKSYWAQWDSLVINDGILCRKWERPREDRCYLQMVVPRAKVPDVLRLYHGVCSGHRGVKRTLLLIQERFYWLNCRDDVEDWCRKCTSCAKVYAKVLRIREHVKRTGQQMSYKVKTRYHRKAYKLGFHEGFLVWLNSPARNRQKPPRLKARWNGPRRMKNETYDVANQLKIGHRTALKTVRRSTCALPWI